MAEWVVGEPQNDPIRERPTYLTEHSKQIPSCQLCQLLRRPSVTHQLCKQIRIGAYVLDAFRCAASNVQARVKKEKE